MCGNSNWLKLNVTRLDLRKTPFLDLFFSNLYKNKYCGRCWCKIRRQCYKRWMSFDGGETTLKGEQGKIWRNIDAKWKFKSIKRKKRPSHFLGMRTLYEAKTGANFPLIRGYVVFQKSFWCWYCHIFLTSQFRWHLALSIYFFRWTTMLGEVTLCRW